MVVDRFAGSPGTLGWVFSYGHDARYAGVRWVSSGLEISMQLRGRWLHQGSSAPGRRVEAGELFSLCAGEAYQHGPDTTLAEPGLQVGFLLVAEEHPLLVNASGELRWAPEVRRDGRLLALAHHVVEERRLGRCPDPRVVDAALTEAVRRHARVAVRDRLLLARRQLDRFYPTQLYVRHFAEVAGLGEAAFARQFRARFGFSPVRYRTLARVNAAARMLATRPQVSYAEIGRRVGFEDESYFFRTFRAITGQTPQAYAGGGRPRSP